MDIRELRINTSVLLDGKRVRITELAKVGLVYGVKFADDETWYDLSEIDPIPITEELLKELGFDKREIEGLPPYWRKDDITFEWSCWDKWRVAINDSEYAYVEYLHEAETFVYLTTKKELI